jgi:hypothetical protein
MTDREKLIELLDAAHDEYYKHFDMNRGYMATLADHLIANGVRLETKQATSEWISVEDRLPDVIPCSAGTAYSEGVIIWTSGRKAMIGVFDGDDFLCAADYWEAEDEEVTHWMPLPEPPHSTTTQKGDL